MKNKIIYSFVIFAIAIIFGCNPKNDFGGKTPVAKVYDKYLFYEDLGEIIPQGTSSEDSAEIVRGYIDVWAKKELMIKNAEINLNDEQKDVSKQLEEYRASLLVYKYKDKFIEQKLDTTIKPEEAEQYYQEHSDDFKLNANAVKCVFVQSLSEKPDLNKLKAYLALKDQKDSIDLYEFCKNNSIKIDNFGSHWIYFSEVTKLMPQLVDIKDVTTKNNGLAIQSEGQYVYYLKILDYKLTGAIAPYEMVKQNINKVMISKQKNLIISEMERSIWNTALDNGNLEYFEPEKNQNTNNEQ